MLPLPLPAACDLGSHRPWCAAGPRHPALAALLPFPPPAPGHQPNQRGKEAQRVRLRSRRHEAMEALTAGLTTQLRCPRFHPSAGGTGSTND